MAKQKSLRTRAAVKTVRAVHTDCTAVDEDEESIFSCTDGTSRAFTAAVQINGKRVPMEIDSGASYSLISEKTMGLLWDNTSGQLKPCKTRFVDYQKNQIRTLGELRCNVVLNNHRAELPLVVTEGDKPSLLGRNWFGALGISVQINQVSVTDNRDREINKLLQEFAEVFDDTLGTYRGEQISLPIDKTITPVCLRARNVAYAIRPKVEAEIDRLVRDGVFEPIGSTEWATPIVPVVKADGESIRLCGDYKRTINQALKWNPYPMPSVSEMLATLEPNVRHFAKLDLAQAYQQLAVDEESAKAQAVVTHKGIFKVKRLQFGVSVAPQLFQRCINNRLAGIPGTIPYFDDILISGSSLEQLAGRVRTVLSRIASVGLKLKKEKCVFFVDTISFLGYEISGAGIKPLESKIRAIRDAKRPTNVKDLQAFLGLVNFYCLFLKGKTEIAEPLHRLLDSEASWKWQQEEENAFQRVKQLLTSDALLVHYDPNRPLVLSCDASPWGVGAVLSHVDSKGREWPIAFFSRTLNATERRYSQLDREACAIIRSVKRFHNYVYGREFEIKTDHKPLLGLLGENKPIPETCSPRMTRWALFLSNYDYRLQYTPGKKLSHADAMSRMPAVEGEAHKDDQTVVGNVFMIENLPERPLKADAVARMSDRDAILGRVLNFVNSGWPNECEQAMKPLQARREELSIYKGCLLWGSRVVIPTKARRQLLETLHSCHIGVVRMKALARSYLWWPGLDGDIEETGRSCRICQESREAPAKAPLHPWEWPSRPWSRLHTDIAGPFRGKLFLIVVDSFSKWLEVRMIPNTSSRAIIEVLRDLFATHGLPDVVVSDNGTTFTSAEFVDFLRTNDIRPVTVAPYHPSSNGQAERLVKETKKTLSRLSGNWQTRIARFLFKQHSTPSTVTGVSPAELLLKRKLKTNLDSIRPSFEGAMQKKQEEAAHSSHGPRQFQEGDRVFGRYGKKAPWTAEEVVARTGPVSYTTRAADGTTFRRHVDQIRSRYGLDGEEGVAPRGNEEGRDEVPETVEIATQFPPDGGVQEVETGRKKETSCEASGTAELGAQRPLVGGIADPEVDQGLSRAERTQGTQTKDGATEMTPIPSPGPSSAPAARLRGRPPKLKHMVERARSARTADDSTVTEGEGRAASAPSSGPEPGDTPAGRLRRRPPHLKDFIVELD